MLLQKLIHRKRQQSENKAYSEKARFAIIKELDQLQIIDDSHQAHIKALQENNSKLNRNLNNYKEKVFHLELLAVALLNTNPEYLSFYLACYSIPYLIAYLKDSSLTDQLCIELDKEVNAIRREKCLSTIQLDLNLQQWEIIKTF